MLLLLLLYIIFLFFIIFAIFFVIINIIIIVIVVIIAIIIIVAIIVIVGIIMICSELVSAILLVHLWYYYNYFLQTKFALEPIVNCSILSNSFQARKMLLTIMLVVTIL